MIQSKIASGSWPFAVGASPLDGGTAACPLLATPGEPRRQQSPDQCKIPLDRALFS
jgi:hypothetical protein